MNRNSRRQLANAVSRGFMYAFAAIALLPRTSGTWVFVGAVHFSRYRRISGDSS